MVSPVLNRPGWVGIPVAGIQRLIEQSAAAS
jgi:predicted trehalose synthase